jgi:hypothetical protein
VTDVGDVVHVVDGCGDVERRHAPHTTDASVLRGT